MKRIIFISMALTCFQSLGSNLNYESLKNDYESLVEKKYILLPHKGTYFLPLSYNNNPNQKTFKDIENNTEYEERGKFNKNLETEFQISFLILTNKDIFGTKINTFVGYTHQAFWQLYNEEWSRPFRETNYMPEFFARYVFDKPSDFMGFKFVASDFGVVHESNGQIQELSRSWNRVFGRFALLSGKTILNLTVWHRLPEQAGEDENPNIYKYKGYGELDLVYQFNNHSLQLKLLPGTEYLSSEVSISTPWKEGLQIYLKASYGYGLSLQDYDHENRKVGIGISLSYLFSSHLAGK